MIPILTTEYLVMSEAVEMLNTKSIQLAPSEKDGLRICVMRYVRPGYRYDVWMRSLAPSKQLLWDYKNRKIGWREYEERYIREMEGKMDIIKLLAGFSRISNICLLCWEIDERFCHRRLLAELIRKMG